MLRELGVDGRGVLRTPSPDRFQLRRWEPSELLRPYVSWYWAVQWQLDDRAGHDQAVLPHPSPHLVVEGGAARLYGPPLRRFDRKLAGDGRVVGVRFRPGGLRPLLGAPVASIVDQVTAADVLAGLDADALARAVDANEELAAAAVLDDALRPLLPAAPDPQIALVDGAVTLLAEDRSLTRVGDLADRVGVSVRSLQRVFTDYVGLGPSWVLRRYRLHEVAARAAEGPVDWSALAADLGYADQAHLVRDFTATVGTPPGRYAATRAP